MVITNLEQRFKARGERQWLHPWRLNVLTTHSGHQMTGRWEEWMNENMNDPMLQVASLPWPHSRQMSVLSLHPAPLLLTDEQHRHPSCLNPSSENTRSQGAREMAQRSRAHRALAEDQCLVASNQMVAHNCEVQFQGSDTLFRSLQAPTHVHGIHADTRSSTFKF